MDTEWSVEFSFPVGVDGKRLSGEFLLIAHFAAADAIEIATTAASAQGEALINPGDKSSTD